MVDADETELLNAPPPGLPARVAPHVELIRQVPCPAAGRNTPRPSGACGHCPRARVRGSWVAAGAPCQPTSHGPRVAPAGMPAQGAGIAR
jgi:hypothetical protein